MARNMYTIHSVTIHYYTYLVIQRKVKTDMHWKTNTLTLTVICTHAHVHMHMHTHTCSHSLYICKLGWMSITWHTHRFLCMYPPTHAHQLPSQPSTPPPPPPPHTHITHRQIMCICAGVHYMPPTQLTPIFFYNSHCQPGWYHHKPLWLLLKCNY